MKRKSMDGATCPVARSLDVIGDWWTLLIVRDAFDGMRRFGEFQRSLDISKGILSTRLKALVDAGIFALVAPEDGGAHHDYVLTEKGRALFPVVVGLRQWGEAHCFEPGESHSVLVEKKTGRAIRPLCLESASGQPLSDTDTEVRKVDSSASRARLARRG
ncbi:Transcriptional regulator, HxlR family [Labilithrix luteola]|uniref:Transcriptional regulator, HxlR family n=1 Tax=Labilithrix luteola TaxID=1391654 RepID=A0A0K1PR59_9BACT|nr:helix-turn-helix domain-containing protein [Labilithrix luteola]AKU95599.1 Transcriptional regulator, HxlR family [Labilithrix luteola]